MPTVEEWIEYQDVLNDLFERADTESQNALQFLLDGVAEEAAGPANGPEAIEATEALFAGIEALRTRCEAVGSSAWR